MLALDHEQRFATLPPARVHITHLAPSHLQGYLPGQLYKLESAYGSSQQLRQLVADLKAAGITPIADVVINHRCADEQEDGVWCKFRDDVQHPGRRIDWGRWAIACERCWCPQRLPLLLCVALLHACMRVRALLLKREKPCSS